MHLYKSVITKGTTNRRVEEKNMLSSLYLTIREFEEQERKETDICIKSY